MNDSTRFLIVSGLLMLLPSYSLAQCVATLNWRWWSNTAYAEDNTLGPKPYPETYSYAISKGAETYINDTVIEDAIGPNGEGKVSLFNGNWWWMSPGWVRTWSGSIECTEYTGTGTQDNGICNGTTLKADSGNIVFNDYHLASANQSIRQLTASHEIGHIFGFDHPPTACTTFMKIPVSLGAPFDLQWFEVNWINSTY